MKNILILFLLLVIVSSCKKDEMNDNPYDDIDYSTGTTSPIEPDSFSIVGLHKNIFSKRCANPGCHDGTFEPDFRTVQSTYSTLVYSKVKKSTLDSISFFEYRVTPGNHVTSQLYERLTTTTSDYMPSNGSRLKADDIDKIKRWINEGAKDQNGIAASLPNLPPNIVGYIALNSSLVRIDTIRFNNTPYLSFIAPASATINIPILALDTADGSSATDPSLFTVHKLKLSTIKDDFSSATTINCTWLSPLLYPAWQASFTTSTWNVGQIVYFRVYVNDGFQPIDVEFPTTSSLDYYKTYFSFIIQ